jgi:hypothetical protein
VSFGINLSVALACGNLCLLEFEYSALVCKIYIAALSRAIRIDGLCPRE